MPLARLCLCLLAATAPNATAATFTFAPPASRLGYTVFALGLIPVDALFQSFTGTLTANPGHTARCAVDITVRMASLHMASPERERLALGATMLDAAHFPTMRFVGQCEGQTLIGALTLHGITHTLLLAVTRDGAHVTASGRLRRQDYGIAGLPGLVGPTIRFHLDTELPPAFAAAPL